MHSQISALYRNQLKFATSLETVLFPCNNIFLFVTFRSAPAAFLKYKSQPRLSNRIKKERERIINITATIF